MSYEAFREGAPGFEPPSAAATSPTGEIPAAGVPAQPAAPAAQPAAPVAAPAQPQIQQIVSPVDANGIPDFSALTHDQLEAWGNGTLEVIAQQPVAPAAAPAAQAPAAPAAPQAQPQPAAPAQGGQPAAQPVAQPAQVQHVQQQVQAIAATQGQPGGVNQSAIDRIRAISAKFGMPSAFNAPVAQQPAPAAAPVQQPGMSPEVTTMVEGVMTRMEALSTQVSDLSSRNAAADATAAHERAKAERLSFFDSIKDGVDDTIREDAWRAAADLRRVPENAQLSMPELAAKLQTAKPGFFTKATSTPTGGAHQVQPAPATPGATPPAQQPVVETPAKIENMDDAMSTFKRLMKTGMSGMSD